jgi:hypothetical protein
MRDMNAMRDGATRTARDVATAARDMADATRGGVVRAAGYARTQAVRASERAGDLASDAGAAIEDLTSEARGTAVRARDWISAHPLHVLAGTMAVGYALGRVLFRK